MWFGIAEVNPGQLHSVRLPVNNACQCCKSQFESGGLGAVCNPVVEIPSGIGKTDGPLFQALKELLATRAKFILNRFVC